MAPHKFQCACLTRMFRKFKKKTITGLLVLMPIGITLYVFYFLFHLIAGFMLPVVLKIPFFKTWPVQAHYVLSFILVILILWFLGLVTSNIFGSTLLRMVDGIFLKAPIINKIYFTIKQIVDIIATKKTAFKQAVMIEYPGKGIKTIAFITGETELDGEKHYSLFVPTTPNPTSGFFCMIKVTDVKKIDMDTETAMKMIISGGMLKPG